jgi:hypothetical protein
MWGWLLGGAVAAAESTGVRTLAGQAAKKITSFWPSIVSGAKTAATTALGYLGFGEIGAGVAAASTAAKGASTVSKVARAAAGVGAAAVYDGKIDISPGDTPLMDNLFNFNAVDFLTNAVSGNSNPSGNNMFEDTKRLAGQSQAQATEWPFWAKAAVTGALIIGTVMVVKGALK